MSGVRGWWVDSDFGDQGLANIQIPQNTQFYQCRLD